MPADPPARRRRPRDETTLTAAKRGAIGADAIAADATPTSALVTGVTATAAGAHATAAGWTLPERYEDLGPLGSGGFGDVRRARDRELGRVVAMKILRHDVVVSAALRARFLAEIRLTAGLSHPGIVAVLDHGALADGRLWFTMPEVRGRTLRAVLQEASAPDDAGVPRRRLLDLFARVCETVAYAHSRGIIHRDLKPDNIMVGEFGQVLVMDWGIARGTFEPDRADPSPEPIVADAGLTRVGDVLGTPAYMAPEQARGEVHRHGPATDVYALGALLHHLLTGRPPRPMFHARTHAEEIDPEGALASAPAELAAICRRAMAIEPEARHPDAGALAAEIAAFLDGARRRERALAALAEAEMRGRELTELRALAERAHADARKALSSVRPSDPVEAKLPGWEREDAAEQLDRSIALRETEWIQAVQGALAVDGALPEAHAALAAHYRDKLVDAERSRRGADAARFEVLLRAHDRGQHAAFLRGDGALTLITDPPGAAVTLLRYAVRARRLVAEPIGDLGPTPLHAAPLSAGSYLLQIRAAGRAEVRYPVRIERGDHWDGRAPGDAEPSPIVLPPAGELDRNDVYIPAGYAWTGGDPEAADALPRRRIWIDGFVLRRHAITQRELIEFLDDIAALRPPNAALGLPAAHPGVMASARALPGLAQDDAGRFTPRSDAADAPSSLEQPAIIDGHLALAYARWLGLRTGKPWRLPDELEHEKAARGADGRLFPWGDHPEPTFAWVLEIQRGEPAPGPVGVHPTDESPYGVRDLAGNTRDWCANPWSHDGPPVIDGRLQRVTADAEDNDFRAVKGGAFGSSIALSRAAARFGSRPGIPRRFMGARLARSYP